MATLVITNLAAVPVPLSDLGSKTLAVGESVTIERAGSDLARMKSVIAATGRGDISVAVTPSADELASGLLAPPQSVQGADVAPVAAADVFGGPLIVVRKTFTAAPAGAPDDVTLAALGGLPYKFRVVGGFLYLSAAVGASTATVRSRSGGAGTALAAFDSSLSVGVPTNTATAAIAPASTEGLFLRRSDRSIAGEVILLLRRES